MSNPTDDFSPHQSNITFRGGMLEIDDLKAIKLEGRIITAWQLNQEEVTHLILNGGKIYLNIIGDGLPPMYVSPVLEDVLAVENPEV